MVPDATSTPVDSQSLLDRLTEHEDRKRVTEHPFFERLKDLKLEPTQVEFVVGQYWQPIHYFTEFLAKVVAVVPRLEMKTFVSKILWQELGEGDPRRAHEVLYLDTMSGAGLNADAIRNADLLPATHALMKGYRESTANPLRAIGYLYGTEVIDLAMVSSLGKLVRNSTGAQRLPWVDIHVVQEPDHVQSVNQTVSLSFSKEESDAVFGFAKEMFQLWSDFYIDIDQAIE